MAARLAVSKAVCWAVQSAEQTGHWKAVYLAERWAWRSVGLKAESLAAAWVHRLVERTAERLAAKSVDQTAVTMVLKMAVDLVVDWDSCWVGLTAARKVALSVVWSVVKTGA